MSVPECQYSKAYNMDKQPISFPGLSHPLPTMLPMYYCPWPMSFPAQFPVPTPLPSFPMGIANLPKKYKRTWSKEQVEELYSESRRYCTEHNKDLQHLDLSDFAHISRGLCRSPRKCMNKIMEIQVSGSLRSGVWNGQEDRLLKELLGQRKKWGNIASAINTEFHKGLKVRTGKQCKERWNNHINPMIERGVWSEKEDLQLLESYQRLGNKWSTIAKELSNRTDSSIKNRVKSLLNREKQAVSQGSETDLLAMLIRRKRAALAAMESASPASGQALTSFSAAASLRMESRCG